MRTKIRRRTAKTLPKEWLPLFGDMLRDELGEQIDNHADFMRCHTDWRRREMIPKDKHQYSSMSLLLMERFDEMRRYNDYFRHTKPFEVIIVCDER